LPSPQLGRGTCHCVELIITLHRINAAYCYTCRTFRGLCVGHAGESSRN